MPEAEVPKRIPAPNAYDEARRIDAESSKAEDVPAQLNDADARVKAGIDPFPPYEEADAPRMLTSRDSVEGEIVDDKEEKGEK